MRRRNNLCLLLFIFLVCFIILGSNGGNDTEKIQFERKIAADASLNTQSETSQEWFISLGITNFYDSDIVVDSSNNCYAISSNGSNVFLAKYSSNGMQIWNRTWGGLSSDRGYGIAIDSSNYSLYIVGETGSFGVGGKDGFLVKYDLDGTQLWNRTWGGAANDAGYGIALDSAGNCSIAGKINNSNDYNGDAFLIKFDSNGTQLWNRTLGGSAYDEAIGVVLDDENNCYLAVNDGRFISGEFNMTYGIFIAKYSSNGTAIWNRTSSDIASGICYDIAMDSLNNFYIVGWLSEMLVLKFDADGSQLWKRSWLNALGTDIAIDPENNCYITGYVSFQEYYKTYFAAFVIKYSPAGEELGHRFIYNELQRVYWGEGIAVDNSDNYFVVGNAWGQTFIFKGTILYPEHISGLEWLFLLILGQILGLILLEIKYKRKFEKLEVIERV